MPAMPASGIPARTFLLTLEGRYMTLPPDKLRASRTRHTLHASPPGRQFAVYGPGRRLQGVLSPRRAAVVIKRLAALGALLLPAVAITPVQAAPLAQAT